MRSGSNSETTYRVRSHTQPFLVSRNPANPTFFQQCPAVPVLPATRLQLDLLLAQPGLNLQAIVGVILSDVGASLQVMRALSRGGSCIPLRGGRIDDCVIHLGRKGLRSAISSTLLMTAGPGKEAVQQLWTRAKLTAELAKIMAARVPQLSPSDAYLAGLLHEVARIPALLGWKSDEFDVYDTAAVGRAMASEWGLPAFVGPTLLLSSGSLQPVSRLHRVVALAWEMSNAFRSGRTLPRQAFPPSAVGDSTAPVRTVQIRPSLPALRPVRIQ